MKARRWSVRGLASAVLAAAVSFGAFAQAPAQPYQPAPAQIPVTPQAGGLALPPMAAPNIHIPEAPKAPNEPAAQVNGEAIPLKEVDDCVALMRRNLPPQLGDVNVTFADISAAERDLAYAPQVSLSKGISQFVAWYREYYGATESVVRQSA